jgi:hypothetical protein
MMLWCLATARKSRPPASRICESVALTGGCNLYADVLSASAAQGGSVEQPVARVLPPETLSYTRPAVGAPAHAKSQTEKTPRLEMPRRFQTGRSRGRKSRHPELPEKVRWTPETRQLVKV